MNAKRALSGLLVFLCAVMASAQDFGVVLNQLPVLSNGDESYGSFEYTGTVMPWLAAPLGEKGDLYLSGGISAELVNEEWKPVPEVYRFEFSYEPAPGLHLDLGRLSWQEPLQLAATGLFDGLALSADLGKTRLSVGAFYTGLLNKRNAYIVMNREDLADYHDRDVYFASRRLVYGVSWEIPALFDTGSDLAFSVFGQYDMNDSDSAAIHTQYAEAKLGVPFLDDWNADLGSILGMQETEDADPAISFAAAAHLVWLLPSTMEDRIRFGGAFSSGAWNDTVTAFVPINTVAQGKVLRPRLSGLALAELEYAARLHNTLSAEISAAYLFRTDSFTYTDSDLDPDSLSPLLGGEVYGGLTWVPFTDLSFTLGGGAFFPQLGKAFRSDADLKYRVSLGMILSF
ncbi:hypothetical protein TREPR_2297 [Treponema primitia ZAS-2]|uniref:Uncharacterized protein n=1 Tax=Treponema primitia (strain ATCC BAA-887 / DSM 12427 / ZAS-2) TaxID=545694 RepID=F5YI08_TREPZ|nr:hypothetical protein [Treponema primitia]AEF85711.1 hypothetical protein TREPR_2297 [Treponema primitia ZAS-2]